MRNLREDLEILKEYNLKLMNAKLYQEEINELILKNLTDPTQKNGKNSCSTGRKEKEQYKVVVVNKLHMPFLYTHKILKKIVTQKLRRKKKNLWNCMGNLKS